MSHMPGTVAKELAELETRGAPALRARWAEVFRRSVPKHMSRNLLLRALAYRVQEQAEGGLSKAALRRLAGGADPRSNGGRLPRPAAPRPRPGTRLIREWQGEAHQVTVLDAGFDYRGARYASLSRIAREITGTRWSGPLFFGLRKSEPPEASPDEL